MATNYPECRGGTVRMPARNPMSNVIYVWNRGRHRNEAHSRATRPHTRYHNFESASSQLVEYVDLCIINLRGKVIV